MTATRGTGFQRTAIAYSCGVNRRSIILPYDHRSDAAPRTSPHAGSLPPHCPVDSGGHSRTHPQRRCEHGTEGADPIRQRSRPGCLVRSPSAPDSSVYARDASYATAWTLTNERFSRRRSLRNEKVSWDDDADYHTDYQSARTAAVNGGRGRPSAASGPVHRTGRVSMAWKRSGVRVP
jgi:hypothetical protein